MQNNEFKGYHPLVNFIYFIAVIGFSCVFMHPICLCISLFSAFLYSVTLRANIGLKYLFFMFLGVAVFNPLFSHEGVTILAYLPDGNPLTLESIIYGVGAALMILSVVCWFSCFNKIITSDKITYLFGKISPSLSLVFSITLRFVPRLKKQFKKIADAQKSIGIGIDNGSLIKRAKCGLSILSAVITWAFENSLETADSMKSRGYGTSKRTAFSNFCFTKRDISVLLVILALTVYIIAGGICGNMKFIYFPYVFYNGITLWSLSFFVAYLGLCCLPVIIELVEVWKWNAMKSKI